MMKETQLTGFLEWHIAKLWDLLEQVHTCCIFVETHEPELTLKPRVCDGVFVGGEVGSLPLSVRKEEFLNFCAHQHPRR